jgi:hypothetical protein
LRRRQCAATATDFKGGHLMHSRARRLDRFERT